MTAQESRLSGLNRPAMLVRAARIGANELNRERSLRRLFPGEIVPAPGQAFEILLKREAEMNDIRLEGSAAYSPARHVELLSALIGEARIAGLRRAA
ncbi:MAG: DUF6477 family protein [Silicimonas sp.]|nr:DUF6477 family protein [Silicimonas sp.]